MPLSMRGSYGSTTPGKGSTVASLTGAGTQAGSGPYGAVPGVPSPGASQAAALGSDVSQMDQIRAIMEGINQQSAQSAMYPLTLNLPGYAGAMGQAMGNVQQYLAGQVPADVINLLQQQAAERGIATGLPGSQNANAAYLRALGLTSLGLQQTGEQQLTNLMGAVPRGTLMDPASLLITPEQQQGWQWMANQMAAAPSPQEAAMANLAALQGGMRRGTVPGPTSVSFPGGGAPTPSGYSAPAPRTYSGTMGPAYDPTGMYDRWRTTQPVVYGNMTGAPAGSETSLYPASQYGLPTWAETASMTSGQPYTWGNQPVSSGQMYMTPTGGDMYDDMSGYLEGALGYTPEEASAWLAGE